MDSGTVVVTSRAPLRVRGEQEYPLRPLPVPPAQAGLRLADIAPTPAVRLFVQRAQSVQPDFRLTEANTGAVVAICRRLDGLPLAIELAAVRLRTLTPADLLRRLARRFETLRQGPRDTPPCYQALQATLDWSYQLLPTVEQGLLGRLAVFVGGWTLEAAEAVGGDASGDAGDTLDALEGLVGQSLVEQTATADESRFTMLETIREYGLERLAERGATEAVRQRHLDYYLALAEAAEPQLKGAEQLSWLNRLEVEHDNLRAALRGALRRGQAELALRLARALGPFWAAHAPWSEGRRWLSSAAEALFEATGSGLAEVDQPTYRRIIAELGAALGEEQYGALRADGRLREVAGRPTACLLPV